VVTWDEAMAVDWVGLPELKSDPPARLPDPDDPWGLIIPSYAREPEDDGEK
jgi:hypothetical protein